MTMPQPVMSPQELNAYILEVYPQIYDHYPSYRVIDIQAGSVHLQIDTDKRHIRAGGTVSGPTLFSFADMGGYACVLSHVGRQALAVTTNLNINFMRKAEPGMLDGYCRILKLGKRLMVFDIEIVRGNRDNVIAQATGTYAIPPAAIQSAPSR